MRELRDVQSPAQRAVAWQVGTWHGEEEGRFSEEIWTRQRGDALMGAFRMLVHDKPVLYEFIRLVPSNDSAVMEITHFTGAGVQWPNQPVVFRSIEIGDHRIVYEQDGVPGKTLVYELIGSRTMRVTLNDPEDKAPSVYEFERVKGE